MLFNASYLNTYGAFMLGFWVLIIFGAKISGSQYNPAVTLAFMFRKDTGRFSRPLGLAYIVFQLSGAFLGCLISYLLTQDAGDLTVRDPKYIVQTIIADLFGSFFLVFIYLSQTEERTKFSKDPAITSLIIAASYVAARIMTAPIGQAVDGVLGRGDPLNPAIALSTMITQLIGNGIDGIKYVWLYPVFPFGGAIIAVIFHEFFYKKTQEIIEEDDEETNGLLDK